MDPGQDTCVVHHRGSKHQTRFMQGATNVCFMVLDYLGQFCKVVEHRSSDLTTKRRSRDEVYKEAALGSGSAEKARGGISPRRT